MGRRLDKAKIVDNLRTKHAALEAALARVPAAAMLEPHFEGAWSVKDLMAHITFWEQHTLGLIQASLHDEPAPSFPEGDIDEVNTQAFLANQARPLPEVQAEFQRSFQAFVAQAEALSEEDLSDPKRFPWSEGAPVRRYFNLDGYGHYAVHIKQIQAWLATQGL
jgi:hypothetical protein